MSERRKNRLRNALNESDTKEDKMSNQQIYDGKISEESERKTDWFKLLFRGILSVILGSLIAGLFAGIMESAGLSYSVSFGSPMMLGLSLTIAIGFWVLLSFVGPYKNE
jgi:hypothetical protein